MTASLRITADHLRAIDRMIEENHRAWTAAKAQAVATLLEAAKDTAAPALADLSGLAEFRQRDAELQDLRAWADAIRTDPGA